jgi:hypothetical protein
MQVIKLRAALAAFAAVGVIAATGAAGVASAKTPVRTDTVVPVAQTALTIARVTGQSTGDGPADDKECQAWADFINTVMDIAADDLREGNTVGAANMVNEAERAESDALGRGCLIAH